MPDLKILDSDTGAVICSFGMAYGELVQVTQDSDGVTTIRAKDSLLQELCASLLETWLPLESGTVALLPKLRGERLHKPMLNVE